MVLLGIYVSGSLKIFVELDLRLVDSFGKSVLLLLYFFKKLVIAAAFTFLARSGCDWGLPPWVSFDLFPIYSIYRVFLEHFLNKIIKLI